MAAEGTRCIKNWPEESREAARLVVDQYGEPDEVTETQLTWAPDGSLEAYRRLEGVLSA